MEGYFKELPEKMVKVVFFFQIFAILTLLYQKAILTDRIIIQKHFVFAIFIKKKILILIKVIN